MELQIQEPFCSHNTRAWTFVFTKKNMKLSKEKDFCFNKKKICILSFVFKEGRNVFIFVFQRERRKLILSLSGFLGREFSHRDRNKKNLFIFIFYFNNGSFWVVLNSKKLFPLFISFIASSQVNPLGHSNPTPTSPTCTRWAKLPRSLV